MLDLHCHILPGIDDGAPDLATALEMARIAIADGIGHIACTPHIYPGMYENDAHGIRAAVASFQVELDRHGLALVLHEGADVHLAPDVLDGLARGRIPTLAGSRYVLLEPPHHVAPPRFLDSVFQLLVAGYVPLVTHPERLSWIEDHYPMFQELVRIGCWMQLTSGSVTGRFGRRPRYWAERMLDDRLVHVLATDSHDARRRPPLLAEGRSAVARRVGEAEASDMVLARPQGIVDNAAPGMLPPLAAMTAGADRVRTSFWRRLASQPKRS